LICACEFRQDPVKARHGWGAGRSESGPALRGWPEVACVQVVGCRSSRLANGGALKWMAVRSWMGLAWLWGMSTTRPTGRTRSCWAGSQETSEYTSRRAAVSNLMTSSASSNLEPRSCRCAPPLAGCHWAASRVASIPSVANDYKVESVVSRVQMRALDALLPLDAISRWALLPW
jgi:hypothetical protein